MAILKVARLGHPVLREVAKEVDPAAIDSAEIQQLIEDLTETMRDYDGAGLAAPQVHVSKRVVVFEIQKNHPRYPESPEIPLTVLINPVIHFKTEARESFWEGCLSIPDLRGRVPRCPSVRLEALDRHGRPQGWDLEGFPAAVVQHECDHLDGVLYLDRVEDKHSLSFLREFQRFHWEKRT
jgi:peptide deformylase